MRKQRIQDFLTFEDYEPSAAAKSKKAASRMLRNQEDKPERFSYEDEEDEDEDFDDDEDLDEEYAEDEIEEEEVVKEVEKHPKKKAEVSIKPTKAKEKKQVTAKPVEAVVKPSALPKARVKKPKSREGDSSHLKIILIGCLKRQRRRK